MVHKKKPHWVRFGEQLRAEREKSGLTQRQLAPILYLSQAMLSANERGTRGVKRDLAVRIDKALNTAPKFEGLWDRLYRSSGAPTWVRGLRELEESATILKEYQPLVVPGLLQTERYARTIIRDARPSDRPDEVEQLVRTRLQRQEILTGERSPRLHVVLDEAVLRRMVGDREIMLEQLDHLLEMTRLAHVVVQVVPLDGWHYPEFSGPFILMSVPDRGEVLCSDKRAGSVEFVDETEEVTQAAQLFEDLRGVALAPVASRALIEKIRREIT